MHGVNPIHELAKLLDPGDQPSPPSPSRPDPAPGPATPGDTKLAIARDLLRHRLAKAELDEAKGTDPGRIADQLVAPLVPPRPARPRRRIPVSINPRTGEPVYDYLD